MKYSALFRIDPDAPNRKLHLERSYQHWLVVNIPGSDLDGGTTLTECKFNGFIIIPTYY